MYDHYLITRFNIFVNSLKWKSDREGNKVQTIDWLISRFDLFEKYTIPSIKNQSCKNFKWLVLFNSETPDEFKVKIMQYSNDIPQFTPIFVRPLKDDATEITLHYMKEDSNKDYIITTRIDNDDMIHRDYMKRIQEEFRPEENLFISFKNGVQYLERNNAANIYIYIRNHYISRIEKRENMRSVFQANHHKVRTYGKILICNDKNMWVEIVHNGNLENRERMFVPTNIPETEKLYGVKLFQKSVNKNYYYFISTMCSCISQCKEFFCLFIDKIKCKNKK